MFSEFRVISVFSFGVNIVQFFPANSVMAVRFPNRRVKSKLHVEKCILENFRDSRRRERSESRCRVNVRDAKGTINEPESV